MYVQSNNIVDTKYLFVFASSIFLLVSDDAFHQDYLVLVKMLLVKNSKALLASDSGKVLKLSKA